MAEQRRSASYSPEVRCRAVGLALDHEKGYGSQWAAISSIASKIGCTAETLRRWVGQVEGDADRRTALTDER